MLDPTQMPSRLATFLAVEEPAASDIVVTSYDVMTGGYSRLLAKATVEWTLAGTRRSETFVLRGDPPPDRSLITTDRRHEWEVLRAVQDRVRVARARYLDPTGQRLGTPTIVLEFSQGTSLLAYLASTDDHHELPSALAHAAASFHTIPLDELPPSLERPAGWDSYIAGRIKEWRDAALAYAESLPIVRYVSAWLGAHLPPPVPLGLSHGDFQSANMMIDDHGGLVLLDWELARIGDPREDLGYFKAVASALPPDLINVDPEGFCAEYRALTGLTEAQLNPAVLNYFVVLGAASVVRGLLEGLAAFARGENSLLTSVFGLNSIQFGHKLWLDVSEQLEGALVAAKERM